MTQDKTRRRTETADQAQDSGSPRETFKAKDDVPSSKKPLDFSKLDLRVEKVDERISPSETNVFDK